MYLAEHHILHEYRVIKCIYKSNPHCQSFLKEIKFLKNLRHPSVPILYDFEENTDKCYIVEEYIKGVSFKELFQNGENVNIKDILYYFIQLAKLFAFLHEQKPYPVIYLDLKPEHVICDNGKIRLLDFGAAVELKVSEVAGCCMGTEGFAAPELISGKPMDERTDIYSIGALFYWCLTGRVFSGEDTDREEFAAMEGYPAVLKDSVVKCLEADKEYRYKSVRELVEKLENLYKVSDEDNSSYRIAVVGSQPHIGVSHFCAALVCYLNLNHKKCLYEEKTDEAFLSMLIENGKGFSEKNGIVTGRNFYGLPKYGKAIDMGVLDYKVIVQDFGSSWECALSGMKKADLCIFIGGIKEWEICYTRQIIRNAEVSGLRSKSCLVLAHGGRKIETRDSLFKNRRIYYMPYNVNPFRINRELKKFFGNFIKDVFNDGEERTKNSSKFKKTGGINRRNGKL